MDIDWGTISANVVALVSAWLAYNQYTKNKTTDAKIEKWKAEESEKSKRRSDNVAMVYGVIWQLLHELQADRVYILQPHPLTNNLFLSISLEVKRNGVSSMKPNIQNLPMSEVAAFSAELATRDFLLYKDVETEVKDKRARSIMISNGCRSTVIRRITDEEHGWIGSIFCGFVHDQELQPTLLRQQLADAANRINYILPEIK